MIARDVSVNEPPASPAPHNRNVVSSAENSTSESTELELAPLVGHTCTDAVMALERGDFGNAAHVGTSVHAEPSMAVN